MSTEHSDAQSMDSDSTDWMHAEDEANRNIEENNQEGRELKQFADLIEELKLDGCLHQGYLWTPWYYYNNEDDERLDIAATTQNDTYPLIILPIDDDDEEDGEDRCNNLYVVVWQKSHCELYIFDEYRFFDAEFSCDAGCHSAKHSSMALINNLLIPMCDVVKEYNGRGKEALVFGIRRLSHSLQFYPHHLRERYAKTQLKEELIRASLCQFLYRNSIVQASTFAPMLSPRQWARRLDLKVLDIVKKITNEIIFQGLEEGYLPQNGWVTQSLPVIVTRYWPALLASVETYYLVSPQDVMSVFRNIESREICIHETDYIDFEEMTIDYDALNFHFGMY
jgi:hypothetical protein